MRTERLWSRLGRPEKRIGNATKAAIRKPSRATRVERSDPRGSERRREGVAGKGGDDERGERTRSRGAVDGWVDRKTENGGDEAVGGGRVGSWEAPQSFGSMASTLRHLARLPLAPAGSDSVSACYQVTATHADMPRWVLGTFGPWSGVAETNDHGNCRQLWLRHQPLLLEEIFP